MEKIRKAILAGVGAGTAVYGFSAIFNNVIEQLVAAVVCGVVIGAGTWWIPNEPK